MPTLEDVKTVLTKAENGSQLYEVVSALANEAQTHKTGLSTLHSTHNKMLNELKTLGYQGGELSSFVGELKTNLEKVKELEEKASNSNKNLTAEQQRFKSLEDTVESLKRTAKENQERADKAAGQLKNRTIKDAILPKIKERMFGAELRAERLINEGVVVLSDDGKIVFKKGDIVLDVEKGLEEYYKDPVNSEDLRNNQNPGSGGNGSNGSRMNGKTMARATFEGLTPTAQQAFLADGGRPV